jgi:parallel beta-helix repeat protein
MWSKWHDSTGSRGIAQLRVSPRADDYGICVGIHNQGAMRIENLRIIRGNGFTEVPLQSTYGGEQPAPQMTGAREFTVDPPNNKKGAVLNLADFGCVSEDSAARTPIADNEDRNLDALNAAIAKARETNASKLTVPKGTYRITSGKSIAFKNLHDFEFDGGGSTFLFDKIPGGHGIVISDCFRTVFRDFNLDWDWNKDPLASIGKITKLAPDKSYFEMRFEKDVPLDPKRWVTMLQLDEKLMVPGPGPEFGNFNPKSIESIDAKTVRVYPSYKMSPVVGQYYLLRHYTYEKHGFAMGGNAHLSLQDVNIYSFPGLGFITGDDQHHVELLRCGIKFPPNERRPITTTADGFHVAHSKGFIKLEKCDFGYMGDDCVNIHDVFHRGVQRIDDHTLLLKNIIAWSCPFSKGDPVELRNINYSPTDFQATITEATSDYKAKQVTLVLDKELPAQVDPQSILFNRRYGSNNIIIRNCYFHENRARGVLLKTANNLVEGNRFYHNQNCALHLTLDTGSIWSEGYGPRNIIVRNNKFESANCQGVTNGSAVYLDSTIDGTSSNYPMVDNILFDSNTFEETAGPIIEANAFKSLVVTNNTIFNRKPVQTELKMRGDIRAEDGAGLWVSGNDFTTSGDSPPPEILFDPLTTKQVFCRDNQLRQ